MQQSNVSIVSTIAEAGLIDLNSTCKETMGWTLLYWAVDIGNVSVVGALLEAGADPNAREDTETVLCRAISKRSVASVSDLVEAGADVNANCEYESPERADLTPLIMAANQEQVTIVQILVDAGAR